MVMLLIPIVIMGTFVYGNFMKILKEEVLTNNLNRLNNISNQIDTQLSQLDQIRSQIFLNKDLRPFYFQNSPLKGMVARDELKSYTTINPLLEDIILYYRGDHFLYSSTSSYEISRFINYIYHYENWSEEEFTNTLLSLQSPLVRLGEPITTFPNEKENMLTFLYPLSNTNINPYGTVLFLIPEKAFQNMLQQELKGYDENSIILDHENNIITALRYEDYLFSQEFQNFLSSSNKNQQETIILNKEKYFLSYVSSPQTKWSYVTLTPVEQVMAKIKIAQKRFMYVLLIIVLLGSVATYGMITLNYNPIRQLKLYTEKLWNNNTSSNEIEAIKNTLDHLSNENLQLQGKVKAHQYAAKPYLLFQILNGHIKNIEECNSKGKEIGVSFTKNCYFVAIFQVHSTQPIEQQEKQSIIKIIEEQLPNFMQGYGREDLQNNAIIFIFNIDESALCHIERTLLELQQKALTQVLSSPVTIGVGKAYSDFSSIPESYLEAITALDYRFIQGNGKVIFFEYVMAQQTSVSPYPTRQMTTLKQSIKQGRMDEVDDILKELLDFIQNTPIPLFVARGLCFDLINGVAQTMHELHQEFILSTQYPDILSLTKFETVEELTDVIKQLCYDLNQYIKEHKEKQEQDLIQEIVKYLQENFDSHQFSIQNAADEFQMSLPAFSQYFKDVSGQTISDYVTYLRMEKAKELLLTEDIPLKEIAHLVGYYNVSSFIRRFKQLSGITPGEYRKQHETETQKL